MIGKFSIWVVTALSLVAALAVSAPASACSLVASRCEPDGCDGPLYRQQLREQRQREAIEHGRAMDIAVEARRDAPGLDRAADVAQLVFPLVVTLVDYADGGGCGPEIEDSHGTEDFKAVGLDDARSEMRTKAGLTDSSALSQTSVDAFAALRLSCQHESTAAFAAYLGTALPREQLADTWDFLIPRAGPLPPADPHERLAGWRFAIFHASPTALSYNVVPSPQHIDGRRERAWQYLQNHRNGRAVMSAVSQFIQSRLADGRGEVAICPVAHAETQRLIGQLAQP